MTGADGGRQLAQAQVGDPVPHRLVDRGGKQPIASLRRSHDPLYRLVHVPFGTESGQASEGSKH